MSESIFGTDGVRGRVGQEPITPQRIMQLGWAAGKVLSRPNKSNKVVIGKDTRVSGYLLESSLEAGFSAAGVDISLIGPMPTPGIAYLTRTARACAGVVISASHNPYEDNGVKIFSSQGTKLADDLVEQIDEMMQQPMQCVPSHELGRAKRYADAYGRYIEFCKSTFPQFLNLNGIKLVVDCANGAAYDVAPHVFTELGAHVISMGCDPNGVNINDNCGSMHMQTLAEKVVEQGADIGIALDGDADRVLLVDANGHYIDGDQLLYILASRRLEKQMLNGGVVGTLMTNIGLEMAFEKMAIPFIRSKVGDRYVHEALASNRWLLGGETSGHIICLDKTSTGDGIVAALEVLQAMLETGKTLQQLAAGMQKLPQKIVNVSTDGVSASILMQHEQVKAAVRQIESQLSNKGRLVLRPSGTEPVIRVMVEAQDEASVDEYTGQLAAVIGQIIASEKIVSMK